MNQQAIALLIEVLNRRHQPCLEAVIEEAGVQHQLVVGLEELDRQRPREPRAVQIGLDFVDGEQPDPLFTLRITGGHFREEFLGNPVDGDAVVGFNNELLLEPELFLEILKLGQKVDQLARDLAQHLDFGQIAFDRRGFCVFNVIEAHDLVLDVEVQLPA